MRQLSPKTLREIRDVLSRFDNNCAMAEISTVEVVRLIGAIDYALKPKRSVAPAKKRRENKRQVRKDAVLDLRATVFLRAGALCEVCGAGATDLEHAFGRIKVMPAPSNCLALCRPCHIARTNLRPNAFHWWSTYARIFTARGDLGSALRSEALAEKHREVTHG